MNKIELLTGEFADKNAPQVQLDDGRACIPQHYLQYQHTLASVEVLISKLAYSERYPIFVAQDEQGIYLQVGIIGVDNYARKDKKIKIVYGRKWRVESRLPSSEIVQTAFLALKKAREHEVRELFRLTLKSKVTTPFSNHHDLTMLTHCKAKLQVKAPLQSWAQLQSGLDNIRYDHAHFYLLNIECRHEKYWLIELYVLPDTATKLPELFVNSILFLILEQLTFDALCYQLMAELIRLSDRHLDENFQFSGVARFSQSNDVNAIANISANTLELHKAAQATEFEKYWRKNNYQVDLTRAPQLNTSVLSDNIRRLLSSFSAIEGVLPR